MVYGPVRVRPKSNSYKIGFRLRGPGQDPHVPTHIGKVRIEQGEGVIRAIGCHGDGHLLSRCSRVKAVPVGFENRKRSADHIYQFNPRDLVHGIAPVSTAIHFLLSIFLDHTNAGVATVAQGEKKSILFINPLLQLILY